MENRMELGLAKPQDRVPGATTRGPGPRRAIPTGAITQMDASFVGCDVGCKHWLNIRAVHGSVISKPRQFINKSRHRALSGSMSLASRLHREACRLRQRRLPVIQGEEGVASGFSRRGHVEKVGTATAHGFVVRRAKFLRLAQHVCPVNGGVAGCFAGLPRRACAAKLGG